MEKVSPPPKVPTAHVLPTAIDLTTSSPFVAPLGSPFVAPLALWTTQDLLRAPAMIRNVQRLCVYMTLSVKEVTLDPDRRDAKLLTLCALTALQENLQSVSPAYCGCLQSDAEYDP